MMENIEELFREHANHFTIYVVEQKFVVGKGFSFFKSYKGKPNYIDTNQNAQSLILKIFTWINKKIPSVAEMIKVCFGDFSPTEIVDVVVAFSKLFGTQEHQAAGPQAIDPIIIQEGNVLKKYINQLIHLHRNSVLAPAIIILLKDNDFERAKAVLSECPDGMYIKFIRNSGKHELYKIVNTGAENVEGFINSFAQQCFSTCSNTRHDILLNEEWAADGIVKRYAPRLLQYRANLLCDEKKSIVGHLSSCISELEQELESKKFISQQDISLAKNFLCIAKIYRIFCNDYGGDDITDSLKLAAELDNEILKAYVYKYAYFIRNSSISEQKILLKKAYKIFEKNQMMDNAIYCKNNILVRQFDTEQIVAKDFADLVGEATSDVPGLVGMPHLFNNAGNAFLMSAQPDLAIEYFNQGLEFAKSPDRFVQKIAILGNILITKSYYNEKIEYNDIDRLFIQIFDGMVNRNQLPFISSRYAMNLLVIAARENKSWTKDFINKYAIIDLLNQGLADNTIGSGQLLMQLDYIDQKLPEINLKSRCIQPDIITSATGCRRDFIQKSGLNPFYFWTWL